MLKVITLTVGDLDTNCYLVSSQVDTRRVSTLDTRRVSEGTPDGWTEECIIIDPGDGGDFISQTILENKLHPTAIILTHGHYDHVLGCLELKLNFHVPILINQSDAKIYSLANKSAAHWQGTPGDPVPPIDQFIKDGDEIVVGNEKLKVIATPGHTPGSICLLYENPNYLITHLPNYLFTGDTLFADGIGSTEHSYSSPTDLETSIKNLKFKIENLKLSPIVYPGHGQETTIGKELSGDNSCPL